MFGEIGINRSINCECTYMRNRLLGGFAHFYIGCRVFRMHPAVQKVSEHCFFTTSCDSAVKTEQIDYPFISKSTAVVC